MLGVGTARSNPELPCTPRGSPGWPLGLFSQLQNEVNNHCLPPTVVVIILRDDRWEDTGLENAKGE